MTLLCNSTNDDDKSYNDQFIIINVTLFSSQEIQVAANLLAVFSLNFSSAGKGQFLAGIF